MAAFHRVQSFAVTSQLQVLEIAELQPYQARIRYAKNLHADIFPLRIKNIFSEFLWCFIDLYTIDGQFFYFFDFLFITLLGSWIFLYSYFIQFIKHQ